MDVTVTDRVRLRVTLVVGVIGQLPIDFDCVRVVVGEFDTVMLRVKGSVDGMAEGLPV